MTEREWLGENDPDPLLAHLRARASERKLRLFVVACVRRIHPLIKHQDCLEAVAVGEGLAEGEVAGKRRKALWSSVRYTADSADNRGDDRSSASLAAWASLNCLIKTLGGKRRQFHVEAAAAAICWEQTGRLPSGQYNPAGARLYSAEREAQAELVREIFGNPFSPVAVSGHWLATDIRPLAEAAYDERTMPAGHLAPDRLAVLSDALEEAGCDNSSLLSHLRSPGPHVRGCWPLDLVLGKS